MILHCLYAAPDSAPAHRCLGTVAAGDAVLLLSAATRLAHPTHPELPRWRGSVPLYALHEDLIAHGIAHADADITVIDYAGWVDLSQRLPLQRVWA